MDLVDPGRSSYDEAACGSSWYAAGKAAGLKGTHQAIGARARRMAKGHAKMYGQEWPLEVSDQADGQDAFSTVKTTTNWDTIAKQLDYASGEVARAAAVGFAGEEAVATREAMHIGRVAYQLRAVEHMEWQAIGTQLGRPYLQTKEDARTYAEATDSPWPIRRGKDPEIGAKAYKLRNSGLEWPKVGERLGCSGNNAYMRARNHAEVENLSWPIGRKVYTAEDADELRQLGGRAYRMRSNENFTWKEIGPTLGLSQKNAILAAKLFAELAGERWPIIPNFRPELGETAYRMFADDRKKWPQIAEELESKVSTVADRAREWSRRTSRPWPPTRGMVATGKLAYEMRAKTNMKWADIGVELNRVRDFCTSAAKAYARENGLPWPIPLRAKADPHLRRLETGCQVYDLRLKGTEWAELIEELGISLAWGHRTGADHARENDLPWPLAQPGTKDVDQEAYELRLTGISWNEIAEKQGRSSNTVHERAHRHAKRAKKKWPIRVAPVRRHFSKRAKRAFELGYGERRPWDEVAEMVGYASGQSALNCAQVYANRFGLDYPRQKTRAHSAKKPERLQKAYELRRDTHMTWAEIGAEIGYKTPRSSFTAALKWAGQNKLPWPPPRPEGSNDEDPA